MADSRSKGNGIHNRPPPEKKSTYHLKIYFCQVCQSWKKLGIRMNLSCYIGYIQSQEKSNSASLRMLLRLWSSAKPESYNVKNLKRVLAAEVSMEMCMLMHL